MIVHFCQPPAEQRLGGLDAAISSLRDALESNDVQVETDLAPGAQGGNRVVHFHGLWQFRYHALSRACRARRIPYIVSPHGMLEPWAWRHKRWKKWPYFHLLEKRFLAGAATLLATAEPEAKRLRQLLPTQRVAALPLGFTSNASPDYDRARERLGWSSDERVMLFLSRLHEKKGLDLLLKALCAISRPANARVVIVGDGDPKYVHELRTLEAELHGKLPPVTWEGAVWGEDRWPFFQGADLFCLPSHSENFALAVLEALQVGTPVLTTRATPWPAELGDTRGYPCDPTVASIAAALERYFASTPSASTREDLARWARERFSWDKLASRYVEFYRGVCAAAVPSHLSA